MKNSKGIEIPEDIEGWGELRPYEGPFDRIKRINKKHKRKASAVIRSVRPEEAKYYENIGQFLSKIDLWNGMTISFHHHLRAGDEVIIPFISKLSSLGIRGITLASSSLSPAHEGLVKFVKNGTIAKITSSGIRGKLGKAITEGVLETPVVIRSHGGRARAIEEGDIKIDLAIVAASASDIYGNANGVHGKSAFGSIGYAMVDAEYADRVAVITDNIVAYPALPPSIKQINVDYVVKVDRIGEPDKIATGATRITRNPVDLKIAQYAAHAIIHSGYFSEGFSFQTGASGSALAVAKFLKDEMIKRNIKGSFAIGGITGYIVEMLEAGLFDALFDVQSFDASVANSLKRNKNHIEISSSFYANPFNSGAVINNLDIVVLGAYEIDTSFNVNVITDNYGYIQGASGGHSDTASCAKLTVVVAPTSRARVPTIKERVSTIVTPGEVVDMYVSEQGICVNPARTDLKENLKKSGIPMFEIQELREKILRLTGEPNPVKFGDKIVGLVEYRDGTIIDTIKNVIT